MGKSVSLIGKQFGRITVVAESDKRDKSGGKYWVCKCKCGTKKEVAGRSLVGGKTKSCGCLNDEVKRRERESLIGKKYGMLTVVDKGKKPDRRSSKYWLCRCVCGELKEILEPSLKNGNTKSCGCLFKKRMRELNAKDLTGKKFGKLRVVKINENQTDKRRRIEWDCLCDCGNEKTVSSESLISKSTRSCGCLHKETHKKMRGKNSPHYNPNLTDEHRLKGRYILGKDKIENWRVRVFEKSNYTCDKCGNRGVVLNAHHLDGWNWCVDKRFEVNNGVALCEGCHKEFHNKYGRGNNTIKQYEEFKRRQDGI